jgi:hypothetical protein
MRFDTSVKKKDDVKKVRFSRGMGIGLGVVFIIVSLISLGLTVYEGFGGLSGKMTMVKVPGFQELDLKTAGLYAGIYQHRSTGPLPAQALSKLEVRVMSKDSYEEIPVIMNTAAQTVNQFGFQVMPLFNFIAPRAGAYTMSAVYPGTEEGPSVPIVLVAQSAQNTKQTVIAGVGFFALFLTIGIIILVKLNRWFPKPNLPKS